MPFEDSIPAKVPEKLAEQLLRDEGIRLKPYKDSVGKLTIGIGRNLDDVGISKEEAEHLLANDVRSASASLLQAFPWMAGLDEVRFCALVNMAFNLGIGGLAEFRKFLAALQAGDYETAKQEMLHSHWAEQVGPRAARLAIQIESGSWQ
jgi:lysozyme